MIDLNEKHGDIARIVASVYGRKIRQAGLEFDDVLQDVYRRVLVSNRGEHPYDPSRTKLSVYIGVLVQSAIPTLCQREKKHKDCAEIDLNTTVAPTDDEPIDLEVLNDCIEDFILQAQREGYSEGFARAITDAVRDDLPEHTLNDDYEWRIVKRGFKLWRDFLRKYAEDYQATQNRRRSLGLETR